MLKWLPKIVQERLITETKANCSDCVMSRNENPLGLKPFEASLKCCTFHPFTPNFAVGGILNNSQLKGREVVRGLIRDLNFVFPIGIVAPPSYQAKFANKGKLVFGRSAEMLCPFFNSQNRNCGIWTQRSSECMSYHCVSDYGAKGDDFWITVKEYLYAAEMHLSQMAMLEKGYDFKEVEENLKWVRLDSPESMDLNTRQNSLEAQRFWAHHFFQVEKYYLDCFEFAEGFKPSTLINDLKNDREDTYFRMIGAAEKIPKNKCIPM